MLYVTVATAEVCEFPAASAALAVKLLVPEVPDTKTTDWVYGVVVSVPISVLPS
ncbi:MAG: hypothetical protein HC933_21615, partial [Pleurocapsa sp. SU_196_0]|nr:hypothetical protein [Pleurocapsa sp. SU_196_0]